MTKILRNRIFIISALWFVSIIIINILYYPIGIINKANASSSLSYLIVIKSFPIARNDEAANELSAMRSRGLLVQFLSNKDYSDINPSLIALALGPYEKKEAEVKLAIVKLDFHDAYLKPISRELKNEKTNSLLNDRNIISHQDKENSINIYRAIYFVNRLVNAYAHSSDANYRIVVDGSNVSIHLSLREYRRTFYIDLSSSPSFTPTKNEHGYGVTVFCTTLVKCINVNSENETRTELFVISDENAARRIAKAFSYIRDNYHRMNTDDPF